MHPDVDDLIKETFLFLTHPTDGRTNGRMDKASYRFEFPQLKIESSYDSEFSKKN